MQVLHFNSFGTLIKQKEELSLQIQQLASVKVPRVEERDSEFGSGELIIENFNENEIEATWSEPILVEGRAWRLVVEPNKGEYEVLVTHISVYLNMVSIEEHLNLDLASSTSYQVEIEHPEDPSENFHKSAVDKFKSKSE